MGLQTGLQDPSHGFPLHSEDAVLLGPTVAAERHEGRLYFYKPSGPIYTCPEEDTERVRLAAALFQGPEFDVSVTELAEFLGLSRTTLWRIRKRYEREAVEGVRYKYRGRPPHKLTGELFERAQALLDEGTEQSAGGRGGGGDGGGDPVCALPRAPEATAVARGPREAEVLGLDRAPEQKTVRRKLAELGWRGRGLELIEAFARRWATEQPHLLDFLYIDGHVRPYHGRAHTLPKTWVARRRLAMPATTDYWVNDAFGEPLFFVTAPANGGLLAILEDKILPEIRSLVGPGRRVTLVMDRQAWSPDRFQRWAEEEGFDVLTYRKGSYDRWPAERFTRVEGSLWGHRVRYPLAEDTLELSNGLAPIPLP